MEMDSISSTIALPNWFPWGGLLKNEFIEQIWKMLHAPLLLEDDKRLRTLKTLKRPSVKKKENHLTLTLLCPN